MGGRAASSAVLLLLLLSTAGCAVELDKSKNTSAPFLMPMSDVDLAAFLAALPMQNDPLPVSASPELREMVQFEKESTQFVWDHILGPKAKARYDVVTEAPCSFSVNEQVHFLKSGELKDDEELDKIYLMYYCANRERSTRFLKAAHIRLKQKYPNLSPNDLETLAVDELEKERARWVLERKLLSPSQGLVCTSNRMGSSTYTDCY